MSKTHTWFGTKNDTELIVNWLKNAGATRIGGAQLDFDGVTDGREFPIHFPSIGPVTFWPSKINLPEFGDNSPRATRVIMASLKQQESPHQPLIDVDSSAVAGIKLPDFRDGRYWVTGEIWFPTARLQNVFPELNRICQRLERFLGNQSTVFDNRKGNDRTGFKNQLCMSGVLRKVVALPEAFKLIHDGAFMVDHLTSPAMYRDFRYGLQHAGHEISE